MIIHEYIAKKLLPPFRGILAHELASWGLSQRRIADILYITQPMVNRYLSKPKSYYTNVLKAEGVPLSLVLALIDDLKIIVEKSPNEAPLAISSSLNIIALHSKPCLRLKDVCDKVLSSLYDPHVEALRRALDEIVSLEGLVKLIPEVGSNIVYDPEASGKAERMIALDGRIVKGAGRAYVAGSLKVGGSRHSARILAALQRRYPGMVKSLMVIANTTEIKAVLRRLGLMMLKVGPHKDPLKAEEELVKSIQSLSMEKKPDVILDEGGPGLEPVGYLVGDSLGDIVSKIKTITSMLL